MAMTKILAQEFLRLGRAGKVTQAFDLLEANGVDPYTPPDELRAKLTKALRDSADLIQAGLDQDLPGPGSNGLTVPTVRELDEAAGVRRFQQERVPHKEMTLDAVGQALLAGLPAQKAGAK